MEEHVSFNVVKEKIIKTNELLTLYGEKNSKLIKLSHAYKDAKTKYETAVGEINRLRMENDRLHFNLGKIKPKSEQNELELLELKEDLARLEEKYQQTLMDSQSEYQSLKKQLDSCTCNKGMTSPKSTKSQSDLKADEKIKDLKEKYKELQQNHNMLKKENAALILNNKQYLKQFKEEQKAHMKAIEGFQIKNDLLQKEISKLKVKLGNSKLDIDNTSKLELVISSLECEKDFEVKKLQKQVRRLSVECDGLKKQLSPQKRDFQVQVTTEHSQCARKIDFEKSIGSILGTCANDLESDHVVDYSSDDSEIYKEFCSDRLGFDKKVVSGIALSPMSSNSDVPRTSVSPFIELTDPAHIIPNVTITPPTPLVSNENDDIFNAFSPIKEDSSTPEQTKEETSKLSSIVRQRRRKFIMPYQNNLIPLRNLRKTSKKAIKKNKLKARESNDTILEALKALQACNISFTISNDTNTRNASHLSSDSVDGMEPEKSNQNIEKNPDMVGFFDVKKETVPPDSNILQKLISGIEQLVKLGNNGSRQGNESRRRRRRNGNPADFPTETETEIERLFDIERNDVLARNRLLLEAALQQRQLDEESDSLGDSGLVSPETYISFVRDTPEGAFSKTSDHPSLITEPTESQHKNDLNFDEKKGLLSLQHPESLRDLDFQSNTIKELISPREQITELPDRQNRDVINNAGKESSLSSQHPESSANLSPQGTQKLNSQVSVDESDCPSLSDIPVEPKLITNPSESQNKSVANIFEEKGSLSPQPPESSANLSPQGTQKLNSQVSVEESDCPENLIDIPVEPKLINNPSESQNKSVANIVEEQGSLSPQPLEFSASLSLQGTQKLNSQVSADESDCPSLSDIPVEPKLITNPSESQNKSVANIVEEKGSLSPRPPESSTNLSPQGTQKLNSQVSDDESDCPESLSDIPVDPMPDSDELCGDEKIDAFTDIYGQSLDHQYDFCGPERSDEPNERETSVFCGSNVELKDKHLQFDSKKKTNPIQQVEPTDIEGESRPPVLTESGVDMEKSCEIRNESREQVDDTSEKDTGVVIEDHFLENNLTSIVKMANSGNSIQENNFLFQKDSDDVNESIIDTFTQEKSVIDITEEDKQTSTEISPLAQNLLPEDITQSPSLSLLHTPESPQKIIRRIRMDSESSTGSDDIVPSPDFKLKNRRRITSDSESDTTPEKMIQAKRKHKTNMRRSSRLKGQRALAKSEHEARLTPTRKSRVNRQTILRSTRQNSTIKFDSIKVKSKEFISGTSSDSSDGREMSKTPTQTEENVENITPRTRTRNFSLRSDDKSVNTSSLNSNNSCRKADQSSAFSTARDNNQDSDVRRLRNRSPLCTAEEIKSADSLCERTVANNVLKSVRDSDNQESISRRTRSKSKCEPDHQDDNQESISPRTRSKSKCEGNHQKSKVDVKNATGDYCLRRTRNRTSLNEKEKQPASHASDTDDSDVKLSDIKFPNKILKENIVKSFHQKEKELLCIANQDEAILLFPSNVVGKNKSDNVDDVDNLRIPNLQSFCEKNIDSVEENSQCSEVYKNVEEDKKREDERSQIKLEPSIVESVEDIQLNFKAEESTYATSEDNQIVVIDHDYCSNSENGSPQNSPTIKTTLSLVKPIKTLNVRCKIDFNSVESNIQDLDFTNNCENVKSKHNASSKESSQYAPCLKSPSSSNKDVNGEVDSNNVDNNSQNLHLSNDAKDLGTVQSENHAFSKESSPQHSPNSKTPSIALYDSDKCVIPKALKLKILKHTRLQESVKTNCLVESKHTPEESDSPHKKFKVTIVKHLNSAGIELKHNSQSELRSKNSSESESDSVFSQNEKLKIMKTDTVRQVESTKCNEIKKKRLVIHDLFGENEEMFEPKIYSSDESCENAVSKISTINNIVAKESEYFLLQLNTGGDEPNLSKQDLFGDISESDVESGDSNSDDSTILIESANHKIKRGGNLRNNVLKPIRSERQSFKAKAETYENVCKMPIVSPKDRDKKINIVQNIRISMEGVVSKDNVSATDGTTYIKPIQEYQKTEFEKSVNSNKRKLSLSEVKVKIQNQTQKIRKIEKSDNTVTDVVSKVLQDMLKSKPKSKAVQNKLNTVNNQINNFSAKTGDSSEHKVMLDEYDCPRSPDVVETPDVDVLPKIIPSDKLRMMPASLVRVLFNKLMVYSKEENVVDEIVAEFATQDESYIADIILQKVAQDCRDKPNNAHPPAPPLTSTQRVLLGFMAKLVRSSHPNIYDKFLEAAEKQLFDRRRCELKMVAPITRLYTAVCKLRKDINRIRRFCCEGFYFMEDFAVPMFFVVLTMWADVLPMENRLSEYPQAKVLVQLCYIKGCNQPGYNLIPLRDLLHKFFGYPIERWNCGEVFQEVFIQYLRNPALRLSDFTVLLFLKHKPTKWVYEKMRENIMPLIETIPAENSNLKATMMILLGNICRSFNKYEEYDSNVIKEMRKWFKGCDTADARPILKRSISLAMSRLPSRPKKKSKPATNIKGSPSESPKEKSYVDFDAPPTVTNQTSPTDQNEKSDQGQSKRIKISYKGVGNTLLTDLEVPDIKRSPKAVVM